jgi:hypothetical protein
MHLTETARRLQHLSQDSITNQVHIGTLETFEQMLLALHGHTDRGNFFESVLRSAV